MKAAPPLTSTSITPSCFTRVKESKLTDVTLLTGFVALLIIGILATVGIFQFMGAANAAYLSYGMYGGAGLFLLAEVIKLVVTLCKKKSESDELVKQESSAIVHTSNAIDELDIILIENDKAIDDQIQMIKITSAKCSEEPNCEHECTIHLLDKPPLTLTLTGQQIYALSGAITSGKISCLDGEFNPIDHRSTLDGKGTTAKQVYEQVILPKTIN